MIFCLNFVLQIRRTFPPTQYITIILYIIIALRLPI